MDEMKDLRKQVGQLLILGFDGLEIDDHLRAALATLQPGESGLFHCANSLSTLAVL